MKLIAALLVALALMCLWDALCYVLSHWRRLTARISRAKIDL